VSRGNDHRFKSRTDYNWQEKLTVGLLFLLLLFLPVLYWLFYDSGRRFPSFKVFTPKKPLIYPFEKKTKSSFSQ